MKRFNIIFTLFIYLLIKNQSLIAQDTLNLNYDSILVNSNIDNIPDKLSFNYSVIRYQNSADVILLPIFPQKNSDVYEFLVSDKLTLNTIASLEISSKDGDVIRISNLEKDKEYDVQVFKKDMDGSQKELDTETKVIITNVPTEFRASREFYLAIADWSGKPSQNQKFIEFLRSKLDLFNPYEIAALMQFHYKLNDINDIFIDNIESYIQNLEVNGSISTNNGESIFDKCNCSLILNTHRDAPNLTESYSGSPEDTDLRVLGNGAAKNMTLRMIGANGVGKYEANIGGAISPLYAIISYNLVCSEYNTDLPKECRCPKKILYDYSYTTKLETKAKKGGGGWIWSAGAEAAAEDYAILTIRNGNNASIADAGKVRLSSNCNSSWNSTWWSKAADLLVDAAVVAVNTSATLSTWANLLPDAISLFSTNFFNRSGDCTDKFEIKTLIAGSGEVNLTTNQPVDILISSLGYEFVRGYGKWDSRSSIISDYHLATVLLGQDIVRPECCTPNVADYFIGNFEDQFKTIRPFNFLVKTLDGSVNSDDNLKGKVNRLFTLWGPWPGLIRDNLGNYILSGDFGHFIRTFPGCAPIDPIRNEGLDSRSSQTNEVIFPNPVTDHINVKQKNIKQISVVDIQGKVILEKNTNSFEEIHNLNLKEILSGSYILLATDTAGKIWFNRFQKL